VQRRYRFYSYGDAMLILCANCVLGGNGYSDPVPSAISVHSLARNRGVVLEVHTPRCRYRRLRRFRIVERAAFLPE
jgi:hypothetical protein